MNQRYPSDEDLAEKKLNKTFQVEKTRKALLETVKNRIDQLKIVISPARA